MKYDIVLLYNTHTALLLIELFVFKDVKTLNQVNKYKYITLNKYTKREKYEFINYNSRYKKMVLYGIW